VTDARAVPLVAHVTAANVNDSTHLDALVADAAGGRADGPTSCRATVATIRNHIVIASPPAALLRSSAVAARPTAAALACSAGSSSARSPGSTGFVASPFAMNATTASITPSSRWGAR
jgi:hypothetical protein